MIYSLCFHMDLDKIAKGGAILKCKNEIQKNNAMKIR